MKRSKLKTRIVQSQETARKNIFPVNQQKEEEEKHEENENRGTVGVSVKCQLATS